MQSQHKQYPFNIDNPMKMNQLFFIQNIRINLVRSQINIKMIMQYFKLKFMLNIISIDESIF